MLSHTRHRPSSQSAAVPAGIKPNYRERSSSRSRCPAAVTATAKCAYDLAIKIVSIRVPGAPEGIRMRPDHRPVKAADACPLDGVSRAATDLGPRLDTSLDAGAGYRDWAAFLSSDGGLP
jgi:hypothetical protein